MHLEHAPCWRCKWEWNKMAPHEDGTTWKTYQQCKLKNHNLVWRLQLPVRYRLEGDLEKEISRGRFSALLNSTIHSFFWGFRVGLTDEPGKRRTLSIIKPSWNGGASSHHIGLVPLHVIGIHYIFREWKLTEKLTIFLLRILKSVKIYYVITYTKSTS